MGLRNRSAVKSFRGDRKGSMGGGEGAEGGRSPNSSSAASRLRSHVLTALQQQLIRIAAVRNTNVPCRNLSAQDLSDATYIAHSPYMENIVSRRVDGAAAAASSARAAGRMHISWCGMTIFGGSRGVGGKPNIEPMR